jgi:hypothetical protein
MRDLHPYTKVMFPALREQWFVARHRKRGHKVLHYGSPELNARCYWRCDCMARYFC